MNSAKDYYNYWARSYKGALHWGQLANEVREYWESRWAALQERKERMNGNSPD